MQSQMEFAEIVDLRSDTVTRPTHDMLDAMISAKVGDDVWGDDPTVNALEAHVAELSGMEAALFTPSGTMANQIAIACWTRPGDEVLIEAGAHPFNYEAAAASVIAGVQLRPIAAERGILDPDTLFSHVRHDDPHFAPVTLVAVENTSNRGGGSVYPQETLDEITSRAREMGLRSHLDGARVFNAVVASNSTLARVAGGFDSLSFCLSKGLGAPVGSMLCGPADFIHRARRVRKLLGGGMRQAGYLAAAGLHALEHHVERLADDHANAARLVEGLNALGYETAPQATNMVYFEATNPSVLVEGLAAGGVLCSAVGPTTIRMVTHLDVSRTGVERTLALLAELT